MIMDDNEESWTDVGNGKKMRRHPSGFFIVVPAERDSVVPVSCPLCDVMFRSQDDAAAYDEFGCCAHCAMTWAHPRRELWASGWRPQREDVIRVSNERPRLATLFETR